MNSHCAYLILITFIIFTLSSSQLKNFNYNKAEMEQGPKFLFEPPNKVFFSNSTGTIINCKAKGNPKPNIHWELLDGTQVVDISGLRYFLIDGSLLFHPFPSNQYNQQIHSNTYRCIASNKFGQIQSRSVHLVAVIQQPYKFKVHDVFAIIGNAAILRCYIPTFIAEFIQVIGWFKDDQLIITSFSKEIGRYLLLLNGDLYIKNTTLSDNGSYKCETKNLLTKETLTSFFSGQLRVTESTGPISPKIVYNSNSKVTVKEDEFAQICCVAQAYPLPKFSWYQIDSRTGHNTSMQISEKIYTFDGCLFITQVSVSNSGKLVCQANNIIGEEKSVIDLEVIRSLNVSTAPIKLISEIGKSIIFECRASSSRDFVISWLKNGQVLKINSAIKVETSNLFEKISYFKINSVNRNNSGIYQCFASNEHESAQSLVELKLNYFAPVFVSTFDDATIKPNNFVSIKCIATGSPLPQIHWYLDDIPLSNDLRFTFNDYTDSSSQVVSFLNISKIQIVDGGEYTCKASNEVEQISHSARINVIGRPTLRRFHSFNKTFVVSKNAKLHCPVIGYPIEYMKWEYKNQSLPTNHRQKIEKILSGDNSSVLKIENIQKLIDEGTYTCSVGVNNSKIIKGIVNVVVKEAPFIDTQPLPPMIYANEGMRVRLVCSVVQGDHPFSVFWFKNDNPISADEKIILQDSEDYSLLTFKKVTFNDRGNYTCSVSNQVDTINVTSQLIVNVPPKWTIEPNNKVMVTFGQNIVVNCLSNGYPLPKVVWKKSNYLKKKLQKFQDHPTEFKNILSNYRNQVFVNGTLVIQSAKKEDTGYYMCEVTNGIGAGLSKVIYIKVNIPAYFETKFTSIITKKGNTSILKCEAFGDEPIKIIWQKDKQPLEITKDKRMSIKEELIQNVEGMVSYLEIQASTRQDSALYTCLASNKYGTDDYNLQLVIQEAPEMPLSVNVKEKTGRSAVITWTAPYHGSSPIIYYIVEYKMDNENYWEKVKVVDKDLKATLNKLMPFSNYFVKIKAVNHIGESEPSKIINFKTEEEVPEGPPLDVKLEISGAHSLKVKWKTPEKKLLFGKIKGYYIGYKMFNVQNSFNYKNYELKDTENNNQEMSTYITNLKRQTTYEVFVQAYNKIGSGPRSDVLKMTTLENSPPSSPNLRIISSSFDFINIGWNQNDNDEQKDFIISYKAELDKEWLTREIKTISKNEYKLDSLKCGTNYNIFMTAKNSLGIGEPSKTINGNTKGGLPIGPSSVNHFCQINSNWITLDLEKWINSGCPIKKFVIKYKLLNSENWIFVSKSLFNNKRTVTINNLRPSQVYELVIIAENDSGLKESKYEVRTLNRNMVSSNEIIKSKTSVLTPQIDSSTLIVFNHYLAILLPVVISILMLVALFSIIIFCIRKQDLFEPRLINSNTLNRISCGSIAHKSDLNVESLPMSDYQCIYNIKPIADEKRSPLFFYSSLRQNHLTGPLNTDISKTVLTDHDYAEPFVPINISNRSKNRLIEDFKGVNTPLVECLYSSIKKDCNITFRPNHFDDP